MDARGAYGALERRFKHLADLRGAVAVLQWDSAAMMPPGGAGARADQLETLALLAHRTLAAPEIVDLLAAAATAELDDWQRANLGEMRREWLHTTAADEALVAALTRATSECEHRWRTARAANDFAGVQPLLARVLARVREVAAAKAAAMGCEPYDALLDEYEPGARAERIDAIFAAVEAFLPGLRDAALAAQARRPAPLPLSGPFPIARQRALCERLMGVVGFDFAHGRLDVSHHPFCGGVPTDVRITTRFAADDFAQSLMAVLHECGHAGYERGLPKVWDGQPVGRARSMSLHESQSLLLEMQVCRSPAFVAFAAPLMREAFGGDGPEWSADNLVRHYLRVAPGLIRVDADEITYPAHVILRYRLERALLSGDLPLGDLPGAWAEGMRRHLGLSPPDDRDGCLQDIHWFGGSFGYFPTYTLGAMTAAQLYDAAGGQVPDLEVGIRAGELQPLRAWLGANVHGLASLLPTEDLITRATGRPLDPAIYRRALERRYLSI
ncbi:MAG: carboxypeptidase M32 [Alphaproteobacteria bacterium]|nr:carboxypeptidase M32 [Alphaproteobacteria bacterium]